MCKDNNPAGAPDLKVITPDLLRALEAVGMVIVPKEATDAILSARDTDGDEIWGGGTEHYFRNRTEGHWYGRQVWRAMVKAALESPSTLDK